MRSCAVGAVIGAVVRAVVAYRQGMIRFHLQQSEVVVVFVVLVIVTSVEVFAALLCYALPLCVL